MLHLTIKKFIINNVPRSIKNNYYSYKKRKIKRQQTFYRGQFFSIKEAREESKQQELYLNNKITEATSIEICNKLNKNNIIENYKFRIPSHERTGFLLQLIIDLSFKKDELKIIDYGGGENPQYLYLKNEYRKKHQFFIVDTNELVELILKEKQNKNINFPENLIFIKERDFTKTPSNADIVFFGSSLQYIEKSYSLIKKLAEKGCNMIVISESIFNESENDFYTLQENKKNISFPNKWHSKQKFTDFMHSLSYELLASWSFQNFGLHQTIEKEDFGSHTFIFKKKIRK